MKTIVTLFLAVVLSLRAEERRFVEFEGTASPDGRYAVGWTFPAGTKVDWQRLRKGEPDGEMTDEQWKYFFDLLGDERHDVENCIIDKKTGQPVLTLSHFDHWAFRGGGRNRSHIHTAWTAKADMVVVAQDARWGQSGLTVVKLSKTGNPHEQDILQSVYRQIVRAVSKRFAKDFGFKRDREQLAYNYSEFQFLDANRLGLHVDIGVPKSPDGFEYAADCVFSLRPSKASGNTKFNCELVSLSAVLPEGARVDPGAQKF